MTAQSSTASNDPHIGLLNEKALHAGLKTWYAQPGDKLEVPVDGFVIDIVRESLLIEIQTGNFSSIKRKVRALVKDHPLRLIYPVARETWIVKLPEAGESPAKRRKSPKRGRVEAVFQELVSFPALLDHPNFTLEVVMTQEEDVRRRDPKRGWRKHGWVTVERRLLEVVEQHRFENAAAVRPLIPEDLPTPFTTADFAEAAGLPRRLARQMVYCLRKMVLIVPAGKRGRAPLYVCSEINRINNQG